MKAFPEARANIHLSVKKEMWGNHGWVSRPNHFGRKVLTAPLINEKGITIPGMTMHLEVKAPVLVDACLYLFSILQRGTEYAPLMYQLEVCPPQKLSHNDPGGQLFGAHEHIGDKAYSLALLGLTCSDWRDALNYFLLRASIDENAMNRIPAP